MLQYAQRVACEGKTHPFATLEPRRGRSLWRRLLGAVANYPGRTWHTHHFMGQMSEIAARDPAYAILLLQTACGLRWNHRGRAVFESNHPIHAARGSAAFDPDPDWEKLVVADIRANLQRYQTYRPLLRCCEWRGLIGETLRAVALRQAFPSLEVHQGVMGFRECSPGRMTLNVEDRTSGEMDSRSGHPLFEIDIVVFDPRTQTVVGLEEVKLGPVDSLRVGEIRRNLNKNSVRLVVSDGQDTWTELPMPADLHPRDVPFFLVRPEDTERVPFAFSSGVNQHEDCLPFVDGACGMFCDRLIRTLAPERARMREIQPDLLPRRLLKRRGRPQGSHDPHRTRRRPVRTDSARRTL